MTKRSPPIPQLMGSTRPSKALAAMAASIADPPRASTWAAACEASVWLVAAIPCLEITMDRAWVRSWEWEGMATHSAALQNAAIRDRESIGDSDDSRPTASPEHQPRRTGNL